MQTCRQLFLAEKCIKFYELVLHEMEGRQYTNLLEIEQNDILNVQYNHLVLVTNI